MTNDYQSLCLVIPDWLIIEGLKKYVVIYKEIIPYIYNYQTKHNVYYLSEEQLKRECEGFSELHIAISNIGIPHLLWGENNLSCWNYISREELREVLIDKWIGLVKGGIDLNINHLKKLIVGINLITHGCVSYADPCSNLIESESIDKRLINALITDLIHCPIHN